jgi:hypothetical protein
VERQFNSIWATCGSVDGDVQKTDNEQLKGSLWMRQRSWYWFCARGLPLFLYGLKSTLEETAPLALLRSNLEMGPFSRIVLSGAIRPRSRSAERQSLDRSGSPADVRTITLDPASSGAIIELASERTRRKPCRRAY